MELTLESNSAIIINHGGERVVFPISGTNSFEKTALVKIVADEKGNPYNPFGDINNFLKTLTRAEQKQLFNVYINVNETFVDVLNFDKLKDLLTSCFTEIYNIVTIDAIEDFMVKKSKIFIPADIESNESNHYRAERTYTPEKYKGLIALSIGLKLAIPIWGAYVKYITKGTGVGRKEIHCTRLLKDSSVVNSRQYNEFVDFVVYTYDAGKTKTDSVIAGFGTEEQATLLPAACLVRKIAVAPNLKSESAVAVAYNYVVNDGPGHERKHPFIKAKRIEKGTLVEERALLETYQINESISAGDLEIIAYYCEQIPIIIRHMCPDIPDQYVEQAEKLRDHLIECKYKPSMMNLRLVQFFVKEIPTQIVPHLDSEDLIQLMYHSFDANRRELAARIEQAKREPVIDTVYLKMLEDKYAVDTNPEDYRTYAKISLLAVLFTVLIYKGYPSIALMVTAEETYVDGIDTSIGNSRKQIPADIDAKLDELFPLRVSGGKDSINMVKDAISRYFGQYSGKSYRSTYTPFFKRFVEQLEDREGNHFLRPETPITLAKITIEIYE